MKNILIIDDDRDIGNLLTRYLKKKGFEAQSALTGSDGLKVLEENSVDLVVCDFKLPDVDGLDLIKQIKSKASDVKIILITGYSDVRIAVQALKIGVHDYVTKPLFQDELLLSINSALKEDVSLNTSNQPRKAKPKQLKSKTFVDGVSQQAELLKKHINLIAPTDMTAVILGETGTGKEYTARKIHAQSKRSTKPFIAVDCGALPENLAASTLFGHKKGAFTGATQDKKGSFEQADGGTLFLDEIGNLSYENQVKLLRVLQEKEVQPLGLEKTIPVDFRLLVATNENLTTAVSKGDFREDLYHRINEFEIKLSPLRNRKDDITIYAKHFLADANQSLDKNITGFKSAVMEKLSNYPWPGNLRELKNAVKRFVLLEQSDKIEINTLPIEIIEPDLTDTDEQEKTNEPLPLKQITAQAEKRAIINALKHANYNKSKAAGILEIDRKTLYNKLSEYNIQL